MRLVAHTLLGAGIAVLFVVNGCGGKFIEAGDGGGGSGGAGGSAGSGGTGGSGGSGGVGGSGGSGGSAGCPGGVACPVDAGPPPGCPSSAPSAGQGCADPGLECEYGTAANPYCNTLWQCSTSGHWQNVSMTAVCPPALCPETYGSDAACPDLGAICEYPQGTCGCSYGPGPTMGAPTWICVELTGGCKNPRPKVGSPCNVSGKTCDYGVCVGNVELECEGGYWAIDDMVGCAG